MPQGIDTWWEHLVDALATVGDVTERRPKSIRNALIRGDPVVTSLARWFRPAHDGRRERLNLEG